MALPTPAPGLVISYEYLWRDQALAGGTSGLKVRPCAVVVAVRDNDDTIRVHVVPITHSDPRDDTAVLLPASIKRRLGLDDRPSWIITDDLNNFVWPGFDLRPVSRTEPDRFSWGYLPLELLEAVKAGIRANSRNRKVRLTNRD